ncbi:MAG: AMP-binding protein [Clostridiaceae bacterium]|jgi:long-chain acyl-CoA synthetase|nr:AMP-binding protein [Clostridiaceae bacterium]
MKKPKQLYKVRKINDLRDMVQQSVKIYGDLDAFLVKDKLTGNTHNVSFKQFQSEIECLGTALCNLGLKNEAIAIISENRYEWCVSYLAVTNGTGVIVPLDKELPDSEMCSLLERSDASAVFCSTDYLDVLVRKKPGLPHLKKIICFDLEKSDNDILSYDELILNGKELLDNNNSTFTNASIDPDAMNMLIFTSGTTDQSKGVMLSHRNITSDIMAVSQLLYADNNDLIMSILPLHHTYECTAGFLTMVYLGVTICFCEGLRHISKNLQEYKPSMIMSVPLILENVYNKVIKKARKENRTGALKFGLFVAGTLLKLNIDIRRNLFKEVLDNLGGNLRLVISGAASLNPKISKALRAMGFNIMQGYGLTECSPIVSVNRLDYYRDKSAGLPLSGIEVAIDNPGPDGIGEIKVKGPITMLGYYKNPEATAAVIRDGWLYTGDNGYIDKHGFLYISGRQKNVIVTKNGKNIFPEDVELYLNKSEYIKESLVYGVDSSDDTDTIVCAKIVPNMEVLVEKFGRVPVQDELYKIIKQEVVKANKKLSSYKKVKHFEIREGEFEKTTTKKIKRQVELVSLKTLGDMFKVFNKKEKH